MNVKDFGAKGDWTTNDTAAIQSALDVVIEDNRFFPATGIKVTSDGVRVANNVIASEGKANG